MHGGRCFGYGPVTHFINHGFRGWFARPACYTVNYYPVCFAHGGFGGGAEWVIVLGWVVVIAVVIVCSGRGKNSGK